MGASTSTFTYIFTYIEWIYDYGDQVTDYCTEILHSYMVN